MSDRDRKPRFQRRGGKGPGQRAPIGRRPAWRDREAEPRRAGHSVRLAHGDGGAGQPGAPDPQAAGSPKTPPGGWPTTRSTRGCTPEIVRPSLIDDRLGPDAVHQGLLAEADPLDSPDIDEPAAAGHRAGARPDHRSAQCRRHPALGGGVRGQGHRHHRAAQPRSDRRAGEIRLRRAGTGAAGDRARISRAR